MNIGRVVNCYGCGVCSAACHKGIISIELNDDGFYEPRINNPDQCNNCGLCIEVCSFAHKELAQKNEPIASYGAWSQDNNVRRKCSSGGVGFEIGRYLLGEDYEVVGCRYNVKRQRAEHYIAKNTEELVESIGSKYIQSYTSDAFSQIDRKKNFLVIGTPCQIDSFRRYIQKFRCEENFILMDFFCHGVPSKLMWDKYVAKVEKEVGKLTFVSWRNKKTGGHDSWAMAIDGKTADEPANWRNSYNMLIKGKKNQLYSRKSKGDMFYRLFLSNLCLGKACYKDCKYKYTNSAADIRIGDLWGKTYKNNEEGVSAVLTFSKLGEDVLRESNVTLVSHPIDIVTEGQLKQKIKEPILRPAIMWLIHKKIPINHFSLKSLCNIQLTIKKYVTYKRILKKIGVKGFLNKILKK